MQVTAVVGASGFVGRHVAEALEHRGDRVIRISAPRLDSVSPSRALEAPRRHENLVSELAVQFSNADAIICCAGNPDASAHDEGLLFAANAAVAGIVAAAARLAGAQRLVHVSSAVVQGRLPELNSEPEYDTFSPYSRSKKAGEEAVARYGPESTVIYRPPAVHAPSRRVSQRIGSLARSPLAMVAAPGSAPTPQTLIGNVASAISFLADLNNTPPRIVHHPSEHMTTAGLLTALGGKRPRSLPAPVANAIVLAANTLTKTLIPARQADARRVELLLLGQRQAPSWLDSAGWKPELGKEAWLHLGEQIQLPANARPTAVVSTTIPMTTNDFHRDVIRMLQPTHDVHVISSPGEDLDELASDMGVAIHPLPMNREITPRADIRAFLSWMKLIRTIHPDVLFTASPKSSLLGQVAGKALRVPSRLYYCGGLRLEGESGPRRTILILAERLTCACANAVVVNSPSLKRKALQLHLFDEAKLSSTEPGSSHGINAQRFRPVSDTRTMRARLGLKEGVPVVGFVGRLTHDKGIDTLLRALSGINRTERPFQLLVVGPQIDFDSQAYAEKLEKSGIPLTMTGRVRDPENIYPCIDVHVLPSLREGFPNVVLEASACGIPTVTTDATGCIDSVINGTTGYIVPTGDASKLRSAILELLQDEPKRLEMGLAAHHWVVDAFRPEVVARSMLAPLNLPLSSLYDGDTPSTAVQSR